MSLALLNLHTRPTAALMKETRDPEFIIAAFLRLRGASRSDVVDGSSKNRAVVVPRHELMWLLRDLTYLGKASIGKLVGGRDHTTVEHGVCNVADRLAADPEYRRQMGLVRAYILSSGETEADPYTDAATVLARAVLLDPPSKAQPLAIAMVSVAAVLRSPDLTDAEARLAALTLIRNAGSAANGR